MKKMLVAIVVGAASLLAQAGGQVGGGPDMAASPPRDDPAEAYFSKRNPKLTAQEKAAVAIADKWRVASATGMKPVAGAEGAVRFVFGAQQANIVCAVLQVCDVELQAGELVNVGGLVTTARLDPLSEDLLQERDAPPAPGPRPAAHRQLARDKLSDSVGGRL